MFFFLLANIFFSILSYILHHFFQQLLKNGFSNRNITKALFYQKLNFSPQPLGFIYLLTSNVFYLIYSKDPSNLDYIQPNVIIMFSSPI